MTIPPYTIAVDAMGGDFAPSEIVLGALKSLQYYSDIALLLTGPELLLQQELDLYQYDPNRLSVCHAPETVGMGDNPSAVIRHKAASSLVQAIEKVATGKAQGFVTAGNSGAAFMAAVKYLKKIPGLSRPALAIPFPTQRGISLLLDAGANGHCQPLHLLHFASLGAVYAQKAMGIANPTIGLLNMGEEKSKGPPLLQEVYTALSASHLHFYGNVEGWDLPRGTTDVVVCDGLIGNIVLKLTEGLGELVLQLLQHQLSANQLQPLKQHFDYSEYGGSLLLGINGVGIITHGRANHTAISNAIAAARRSIQTNVIGYMQQHFTV